MKELDLRLLDPFAPYLHANNFLHYLNLNNLDSFIDYLKESEADIAQQIDDHKSDIFVYHGSDQLIDKLSPQVSTGGGNENKETPLVYATTIPDYAIFLGCLRQTRGEGKASVKQDSSYNVKSLLVSDKYVNGTSTLGAGYVYVFSSRSFKVQPNNPAEWYSEDEVTPLFWIKVDLNDLVTPITVFREK